MASILGAFCAANFGLRTLVLSDNPRARIAEQSKIIKTANQRVDQSQ